jgi:hypothetical protein
MEMALLSDCLPRGGFVVAFGSASRATLSIIPANAGRFNQNAVQSKCGSKIFLHSDACRQALPEKETPGFSGAFLFYNHLQNHLQAARAVVYSNVERTTSI